MRKACSAAKKSTSSLFSSKKSSKKQKDSNFDDSISDCGGIEGVVEHRDSFGNSSFGEDLQSNGFQTRSKDLQSKSSTRSLLEVPGAGRGSTSSVVSDIQEELDEQKRSVRMHKQLLNDQGKTLARSETLVMDLERENAMLKQSMSGAGGSDLLQSMDQTIKQLRAEKQALQDKYSTKSSECLALKAQLDALHDEYTNYKSRQGLDSGRAESSLAPPTSRSSTTDVFGDLLGRMSCEETNQLLTAQQMEITSLTAEIEKLLSRSGISRSDSSSADVIALKAELHEFKSKSSMGELGKAQLSEMELKTGAMHRLSMRVQELESELAHRTAMLSLNGDVKDVEDKIRTITAENVVLRAAAEDAKKELLDSSKRLQNVALKAKERDEVYMNLLGQTKDQLDRTRSCQLSERATFQAQVKVLQADINSLRRKLKYREQSLINSLSSIQLDAMQEQ